MENIIENKERAQFLSLIIKKISKDRLSAKEVNTYKSLKYKVDPESELELELTNEWKKAESQPIAERVYELQSAKIKDSIKNPKQYFINVVGKILSSLI